MHRLSVHVIHGYGHILFTEGVAVFLLRLRWGFRQDLVDLVLGNADLFLVLQVKGDLLASPGGIFLMAFPHGLSLIM